MGRYDLRLTEQEFWSLTPRQFEALAERHRAHERTEWERSAIIASTVYNMLRGKRSRPRKITDFMPRERKRQSPEQMLGIVQGLASVGVGRIIRGER